MKTMPAVAMAASTTATAIAEETTHETKKNEQETATYPCSCHCGSITFTVTLSPSLASQRVMECNCSICRRAGYLLVYTPKEAVEFLNGSQARLSKYRFNNKRIDHLFCGYCGSSLGINFHDFRQGGYGVSVRAFNDVDLEGLAYQKGDGKTVIPPYSDLSGVQWALDQAADLSQQAEKEV
ncbi:Mss4-like protein [Triangularia setosa]|uniref:Mss4-like protein n=1 Tax=Triangularia setosa TaxID=2587417 RepID=A0AAN7ACL9_9PEZI|nr:Mss4-like protein [Podospora setosa]